jgi:hypothetical protein
MYSSKKSEETTLKAYSIFFFKEKNKWRVPAGNNTVLQTCDVKQEPNRAQLTRMHLVEKQRPNLFQTLDRNFSDRLSQYSFSNKYE